MGWEDWDDRSRLTGEEAEAQEGRGREELSLTVLLPWISEEMCLGQGQQHEQRRGGEQAQTLQGAERGMRGWS